jgi:ketol-acid reductoisomerase
LLFLDIPCVSLSRSGAASSIERPTESEILLFRRQPYTTRRKAMKEILTEIQDGSFAKRFIADQNSGRKEFLAFREAESKLPVETVGKKLRASMPFLDPTTVEEISKTR